MELRYFTAACHTQLPGQEVIDVIPKDGLPMPECPVEKDVPLKRIIRLINNLVSDLSLFPKSLMSCTLSVSESDRWPLIFEN